MVWGGGEKTPAPAAGQDDDYSSCLTKRGKRWCRAPSTSPRSEERKGKKLLPPISFPFLFRKEEVGVRKKLKRKGGWKSLRRRAFLSFLKGRGHTGEERGGWEREKEDVNPWRSFFTSISEGGGGGGEGRRKKERILYSIWEKGGGKKERERGNTKRLRSCPCSKALEGREKGGKRKHSEL